MFSDPLRPSITLPASECDACGKAFNDRTAGLDAFSFSDTGLAQCRTVCRNCRSDHELYDYLVLADGLASGKFDVVLEDDEWISRSKGKMTVRWKGRGVTDSINSLVMNDEDETVRVRCGEEEEAGKKRKRASSPDAESLVHIGVMDVKDEHDYYNAKCPSIKELRQWADEAKAPLPSLKFRFALPGPIGRTGLVDVAKLAQYTKNYSVNVVARYEALRSMLKVQGPEDEKALARACACRHAKRDHMFTSAGCTKCSRCPQFTVFPSPWDKAEEPARKRAKNRGQ